MSDEKRIEEIKNEDKKKAPIFFVVLVISCLLGGVGGGVLAKNDAFWDILRDFLTDNSQIVSVIFAAAILIYSVPVTIFCEMKLAGLKSLWKDEEKRDDNWEKIGKGIGVIVNIMNVSHVVIFLLNGCAVYNLKGNILGLANKPAFYDIIFKIAFFGSLAAFSVFLGVFFNIQRRAVQLEKIMNPEKKGSVFDFFFLKKWVKSFDEAEMKQVGIASFKAFSIVNITCIAMMGVLICLGMVAQITVIPHICVAVIWIVQVTAFGIESERAKWKKR